MNPDDFAAALKEHLTEQKGKFSGVNEWCGSTETGFYDEEWFDFDAMLKEIDDFSASFKQRKR